ncbi:hypothetical protein L0Y65_00415 [Candidatus Micrarchaeota archaeon]|nr:hypothetical protein [Candidatus Micrarchaeota archaeon]
MKGVLLLILIAGLASAQFEDTDAKLAQCQRDCCSRMNGSWDDSLGECGVGAADYNAYYRCRNECSEIASRDYGAMGGGAGICCAPAFFLLGLALAFARQ